MVKVRLYKVVDPRTGNVVLRDPSGAMDEQSLELTQRMVSDPGFQYVVSELRHGYNPRRPQFLYMLCCDPQILERQQKVASDAKRKRKDAQASLGVFTKRLETARARGDHAEASRLASEITTLRALLDGPKPSVIQRTSSRKAQMSNKIGVATVPLRRFDECRGMDTDKPLTAADRRKLEALFAHESWFMALCIYLDAHRTFSALDCKAAWRACKRKVERRALRGVNFALDNELCFYFSRLLLNPTKFPSLTKLRERWAHCQGQVAHTGQVLAAVPEHERDRDWRSKVVALLPYLHEYTLVDLHRALAEQLETYDAPDFFASNSRSTTS